MEGVEAKVSHRLKERTWAIGGLRCLRRNRDLSVVAKVRMIEVVVVPTMLYGSGTWGVLHYGREKSRCI